MSFESRKTEKLFEKMKEILKENPLAFIEYEIYTCKKCSGTGLGNLQKLSSEATPAWDGVTFCPECHGIGFFPPEKIYDHLHEITLSFHCNNCGGGGCRECNYTGFVDWIKHARGG